MRKFFLISGVILCFPLMGASQDYPKVEVFTGYSYLRGDFDANFNGWNVSVAGNVNNWFGVVGDVSGHYLDNGAKLHSFLVGPKFTHRVNDRVNPYVQTLIGAVSANADFLDDTAFGWTVGGGLDVKVHKRVAIRVIEANYLLTRFFDQNQHNGRLSAGLVWRFGGN
jgi:opacity protein-like surface antigen